MNVDKLVVEYAMHCIQYKLSSILMGKKGTRKSLTVLKVSSVFLLYNTGAAATTFVVNDPEKF